MAAPPSVERHKPHWHLKAPVKEPVRVSTTANVTIATALNVGDVLDGVTLADLDRVLVAFQSAGAENGIYIAGASPARAPDFSTDDPDVRGSLVFVREGTAHGGALFINTNTTIPTIGSTSITFVEFGGGVTDHGALTGLSDNDHPQYLEFDP